MPFGTAREGESPKRVSEREREKLEGPRGRGGEKRGKQTDHDQGADALVAQGPRSRDEEGGGDCFEVLFFGGGVGGERGIRKG